MDTNLFHPSRLLSSNLHGPGEDAADEGEKLLLAADNAIHFKQVRPEMGEIDFVYHRLAASGEQEAVMTGDVGDDEAGEVAFAAFCQFSEGCAEVMGAAFEMLEIQFFDLADADAPAVFHEFLAVGVEDDLGGAGAKQGACCEEVLGEFRNHDASLPSQPREDLPVGGGGGGGGEIQGIADQAGA